MPPRTQPTLFGGRNAMSGMTKAIIALGFGIVVSGCEYPQTRMEAVYPTTAPATASPTNSAAKPETVKKREHS
jgi:hypothetical protein